jgi:diguanylate cyclase (GGDEF)-like protein/PAS domain S-box-containing protein
VVGLQGLGRELIKDSDNTALVELLYEQAPTAILLGVLNALLVMVATWGYVPHTLALYWLACVLLLAFARVRLVRNFRRRHAADGSTPPWAGRYVRSAFYSGVLWGVAGTLLVNTHVFELQALSAFILGGMTAGAVFTNVAHRGAFFAFTLPMLLPLPPMFLMEGSRIHVVMALLTLAFLLGTARAALRAHATLRRSIELAQENSALLGETRVTQMRLQESERRLHAIFSNMSEGVALHLLVFDAHGNPLDYRIIEVNAQYEAMLDLRRDAVVGKLATEVYGTSEAPYLGLYSESARTGRPVRFQTLFAPMNKYFDISVVPWEGNGFATIFEDITERKQAEAGLRVAAIAFESQEAMFVTDANRVIQRVNSAFTQTTGYSALESVGQTPRILHSGRHDSVFYESMWSTIRRDGHWQGEVWNRRKNGEIYPEWLTISAVKDGNGQVTNYVGIFQDMSESKAREDQIRTLAFYDSLTRLPNRRLLLDRLRQAMASSSRTARHCALLFIDLDNFKLLNDTRGHDVGDLLLDAAAQRLQACIRSGDTVARLGGDEFVVLLEDLDSIPEAAAKQSEMVAAKILEALGQHYLLGQIEHHSTASIGVALFQDKAFTVEEILKRADLAMYQAKSAGRATIRFFDPAMQAAVEARASLEAELRRAVQRREFVLHYQPQVDKAGRVAGVEALARWSHPQRGLLSPLVFVAMAEETGLIIPIGQQLLREACEQIRAWSRQEAAAHLTVSVNISPRQFRHPDFLDMVRANIEETGIDPRRLMLEITESLLLDNVDEVVAKMESLKAEGLRFSIDDFGTGYSSLAYLKRLPLDELKVDRSFVAHIETDDNAAAICAAMISLAHTLGLKVVAEGVETEAQRYFLSTVHKCDQLQGYLFGKPMAPQELERLLDRAGSARR